jgi:hypothetical protein
MLRCDRCGSGFSGRHLGALEYCPRCLGKKEAISPLVFPPLTSRAGGGAEAKNGPILVGETGA